MLTTQGLRVASALKTEITVYTISVINERDRATSRLMHARCTFSAAVKCTLRIDLSRFIHSWRCVQLRKLIPEIKSEGNSKIVYVERHFCVHCTMTQISLEIDDASSVRN